MSRANTALAALALGVFAHGCSEGDISPREFKEEASRLNFGSEEPELAPVFSLTVGVDSLVRWNGKALDRDGMLALRQEWLRLSVQPALEVSFASEVSLAARVAILREIDHAFGCGKDFACLLASRKTG